MLREIFGTQLPAYDRTRESWLRMKYACPFNFHLGFRELSYIEPQNLDCPLSLNANYIHQKVQKCDEWHECGDGIAELIHALKEKLR